MAAREAAQGELTAARVALATVSEKAASLERSLRAARADGGAGRRGRGAQGAAGAGRAGRTRCPGDAHRRARGGSRRAAQARDAALAALEAQSAARQALLQESYQASAQMRLSPKRGRRHWKRSTSTNCARRDWARSATSSRPGCGTNTRSGRKPRWPCGKTRKSSRRAAGGRPPAPRTARAGRGQHRAPCRTTRRRGRGTSF